MSSEWQLFWVGDGGAPNVDGATAGWEDLAERERALGLRERQPILVSPDGRVDPQLAECFRRSAFSAKSADTQATYAPLYRLFFSFLWQRGRNWDQATPDDIEDWEDWRRRGEETRAGSAAAPGARSRPRSSCSTTSRPLGTSCRPMGRHIPGTPISAPQWRPTRSSRAWSWVRAGLRPV